MFDNKGERIPPCGVPFVGIPSPSISAFNSLEIIERSDFIPNA